MNRPADVQPLRIALLTHSTLPRGGVVHALAVGNALADAGHHVRLLAPVQPGEALFRAPRSPRCRFIGVPARPVMPVEPTQATFKNHLSHSIDSAQDTLVRLVQRRIDDWLHYFETASDAFDVDVFHAQDSISANALANLVEAGRLSGFVRTVHHLDVFANPQLAAWQRRGFHAASQVCCVSEVWREKLWRDEGVDAALVRNGVDRYRFSPEPDAGDAAVRSMRSGRSDTCNDKCMDARNNGCPEMGAERYTIGAPRAPIFLSVGGVEARKNTLNALSAYVLWREQAHGNPHPESSADSTEVSAADSDADSIEVSDANSSLDLHSDLGPAPHSYLGSRAHLHRHRAQWWIAGGASLLDHRDYGQRFMSMAAAAGLRVGHTLNSTADIVLLGRIDDTLMPALFRAADALLFPSLVEGFGLVVLEALSVGTPVITSRIAPFTEYLPELAVEWVDPLVPRSIAAAMCRAVPFTHSRVRERIASSATSNAQVRDTQVRDTQVGSAPAADTHSGNARAINKHVADEQRRQAGFAVAASFSWAHSALQHSDLYRRWLDRGPSAVVRAAGSDVPKVQDVPVDAVPIASRNAVSEQESHHA